MGALLNFLSYIAKCIVQLLIFLFFICSLVSLPDLEFVTIGNLNENLIFFAHRNHLIIYAWELDVCEPLACCTVQFLIPSIQYFTVILLAEI